MAVFTSKKYSMKDYPPILENFRWPELFWVEDHIGEHVRNRWVPLCPPRHPNNYERMWEHFRDCIVTDSQPLTSGEDGARAVEVMCAVFKSMETNAWVELPLDEEVIPPHYRPLPRE